MVRYGAESLTGIDYDENIYTVETIENHEMLYHCCTKFLTFNE